MTEIDVPDWVALLAEDRYSEAYYKGMTRTESMKAALTAALGAWVVPACYRLHQPNHSSEWISGMYGGPPMTHKAWAVEQTFTLRQEKPE